MEKHLKSKWIKTPQHFDVALSARGIAAVLVVLWHAHFCAFAPNFYSPLIASGRLAVWIFFVLSGYLISFGFLRDKYHFSPQGISQFMTNRFLRIYPLFLFVSICALVISTDAQHHFLSAPFQFISEQLLMFQWNHKYIGNGAFWTLGIEWQFYLSLPFVLLIQNKLFQRFKLAPLFIYFTLLFSYKPLSNILINQGLNSDCKNLLGNYVHFQTGILFCFYANDLGQLITSRLVKLLTFFCILFLFMSANYLYHFKNDTFFQTYGMLNVDLLGFLILFLHLGLEKSKIIENWIIRFLHWGGVFSFGIYAWHAFIQTQWPKYDKSLLLVGGGSLLLTFMTYFLIEKPLQRLKI